MYGLYPDDPQRPDPGEPPCPVCPNGEGEALGTLGRLVWYRCQQCGIDFNHQQQEE